MAKNITEKFIKTIREEISSIKTARDKVINDKKLKVKDKFAILLSLKIREASLKKMV